MVKGAKDRTENVLTVPFVEPPNRPAFSPISDDALSLSKPPQLWKRMTPEHKTLSGGERNRRWLIEESNRLLALSRDLQDHADALSRYLRELLRAQSSQFRVVAPQPRLSMCRSSSVGELRPYTAR